LIWLFSGLFGRYFIKARFKPCLIFSLLPWELVVLLWMFGYLVFFLDRLLGFWDCEFKVKTELLNLVFGPSFLHYCESQHLGVFDHD